MIRSSLRPRLLPVVPYRGLSIPSRQPTTSTSNKKIISPKNASPSASSSSSSSFTTSTYPISSTYQPSPLVEQTIRQAAEWANLPQLKNGLATKLADDSSAVPFVMKFTDWVMRVESPKTAAAFLSRLVSTHSLPSFMSSIDRTLVSVGGVLAPYLPNVVIQSAKLRMRAIVSNFVSDVEKMNLIKPSEQASSSAQSSPNGTTTFIPPVSSNVNLLGEAILGKQSALKRRDQAIDLINHKDVNYVSLKVSGVTTKLNKWDYEGSLNYVLEELTPVYENALNKNPKVFVNLDMEEYHDLQLTIDAFVKILSQPKFQDLDAGIVIQAYLPDALPSIQYLVNWANNERPGNGQIKIRIVKGANLAMEKVEAEVNGWEQVTYTSKSDTDANYLKCLDWAFNKERLQKVKIGIASHNLFTLAYAKFLAEQRNVINRIGFENLNGMIPTHTPVLAKETPGMTLYTPVCKKSDFESAISYLFRRFEETSSPGNFLHSLPSLSSNSESFKKEQIRFNTAHTKQNIIKTGPKRKQDRPAKASHMTMIGLANQPGQFVNEPNSDPVLENVREWAIESIKPEHFKPVSNDSWVSSVDDMDEVLNRARIAQKKWNESTTPKQRREILTRVADIIAQRRGDFYNVMINEGQKTVYEADIEISEAVDFANYYGLMAEDLPNNFTPFGVITVAAPWNFPSAIGGGGAMSAIASGNACILKPSPNAPRCLELMAECMWEGGVPKDVLQFVQCPENEVGKHLITKSDAVILTGATDTAELFHSWKPDLHLFAETSGKNALVISPAADLDQAVADLVKGAFGNAGQKCSASSLAICIGDLYESEKFRQQLKDAVESIGVGPSTDIATSMGPVIMKPEAKLSRALTQLEDGEEWLVEPKCLDADGEGRLWTPGVRLNVKQGSWFHVNEAFGPVLGVMRADNLQHALELQNQTKYGLTGGIHSLDVDEINEWKENVHVGNVYINRGTTGAIVRRQCFGGWKASCVGPGAKAGGPNYVSQFGIIKDDNDNGVRDETWLAHSILSDEKQWEDNFSKEHDPTGLHVESNVLRYRPLHKGIVVRIGPNANSVEVERVKAAINRCGTNIVYWSDHQNESEQEFVNKMNSFDVERIRTIGNTENQIIKKANENGVHVANAPVLMNGKYELLHYLREQSVSRTLHRFGNMATAAQ